MMEFYAQFQPISSQDAMNRKFSRSGLNSNTQSIKFVVKRTNLEEIHLSSYKYQHRVYNDFIVCCKWQQHQQTEKLTCLRI